MTEVINLTSLSFKQFFFLDKFKIQYIVLPF